MDKPERATEQCWFRITPTQKKDLEKLAKSEGRKPANYVTWLITKHLELQK